MVGTGRGMPVGVGARVSAGVDVGMDVCVGVGAKVGSSGWAGQQADTVAIMATVIADRAVRVLIIARP